MNNYKPQINLARSTTGRMWLLNLCTFLVVIQSSLTDSYSSLLVALGAVCAAVLTEFLLAGIKNGVSTLKNGSAVATALILALLLPNRIHPLYAAAGACFAIAIIKQSFGGLGSNWLNPAAGGWLFIRFSWPAAFANALSVTGINADYSTSTSFDTALSSFFNRTILSFTGGEIPSGYMDLFASRLPGIIADRGIFALLLGTIIITASQVNRSWIPAVYLFVFSFLVRLAGDLPLGGEIWKGDMLYMLCSGGTIAAAFLLAADPATGAKSNRGILFSTIASGAIAFVFRCFGNETYGAIITALLINAVLPAVRFLENSRLYRKQGLSS